MSCCGGRGPLGLTGSQGPQGSAGSGGSQGPQGIQGSQGAQGAQGAQGGGGASELFFFSTINFGSLGGASVAYFGGDIAPSLSPVGPNGVAAVILSSQRSFSNILVGLDTIAPMGGFGITLMQSTDNGMTYTPVVPFSITGGSRLGLQSFGPVVMTALTRLVIEVVAPAGVPSINYHFSVTLS